MSLQLLLLVLLLVLLLLLLLLLLLELLLSGSRLLPLLLILLLHLLLVLLLHLLLVGGLLLLLQLLLPGLLNLVLELSRGLLLLLLREYVRDRQGLLDELDGLLADGEARADAGLEKEGPGAVLGDLDAVVLRVEEERVLAPLEDQHLFNLSIATVEVVVEGLEVGHDRGLAARGLAAAPKQSLGRNTRKLTGLSPASRCSMYLNMFATADLADSKVAY